MGAKVHDPFIAWEVSDHRVVLEPVTVEMDGKKVTYFRSKAESKKLDAMGGVSWQPSSDKAEILTLAVIDLYKKTR